MSTKNQTWLFRYKPWQNLPATVGGRYVGKFGDLCLRSPSLAGAAMLRGYKGEEGTRAEAQLYAGAFSAGLKGPLPRLKLGGFHPKASSGAKAHPILLALERGG